MATEFHFHTLTRDFLAAHVQEFIVLLNANLEDEYWNETHFSSELNKKWLYSFYVADNQQTIIAFMIASEKPASVHIHKFVIDRKYQRAGLGSQMLRYLQKHVVGKAITLKVNRKNQKAVNFYLKTGFQLSDQQGDQCAMILPISNS